MIDLSKRKTLKIMSTAGAATLCSFPALASTPIPATIENSLLATDLTIDGKNSAVGTFNIQIITGRTSPEDTIIFNNHSGADIQIRSFLPGYVTQNEQMIDLNSLVLNGPLTLRNGYPLATKAASWKPLSLDSDQSYLWCDTAVSRFPNSNPGSDTGSDTGIITLDAVINNGRALLTAIHDEILLS